jgi:hypothetical protein
MAQNEFYIKLRATAEGRFEVETDPPTKPIKGTTSATITEESDRQFIISPSNMRPRTLIHIPSTGIEFVIRESINDFSIRLRATAEGRLEVETDPPTKPIKGTTSADISEQPNGRVIIDGLLPSSSSSPSNMRPGTLIHIPSIDIEFVLDEGWGRMTVNRYTDTPATSQAEPPAEPPHN